MRNGVMPYRYDQEPDDERATTGAPQLTGPHGYQPVQSETPPGGDTQSRRPEAARAAGLAAQAMPHAPQQTFAQMRDAGIARPPAPAPGPAPSANARQKDIDAYRAANPWFQGTDENAVANFDHDNLWRQQQQEQGQPLPDYWANYFGNTDASGMTSAPVRSDERPVDAILTRYEQPPATIPAAGPPITTSYGGGGPHPGAAPSPVAPPLPGGGGQAGQGAGYMAPANASTFDLLTALTGGAQGQGAGSAVQKATQQSILDLLTNPSPYGTQQVKDLFGSLGGEIDDEYALKQSALDEEMARRGLGVSTNKAGRLNDLNIGRRDAKTRLAGQLAQDYARSLGDYRLGAIGAGNTVGTQAQRDNLDWLGALMGYGQQAFTNDLATNAQNMSAENSYRDYILRLLGAGYGG